MADFAGHRFFSDDNSLERAPNLVEWIKLHQEASLKFGKDIDVARRHRQWMIDAGFSNVKEEVYEVYLYPSIFRLIYLAVAN